ncbi:MAG TPA: hypothetical protein VIG62_25545 [Blastocatellia bacterium]|jgi:hypothetical protein
MPERDANKTEAPVDWLLSRKEPWVVLNTRLDLLGQREDDPEVESAYSALKKNKCVATLLDEVKVWPQERRLGRAYDPKDSLWKLSLLADFGLRRDDARVASVAKKVFDAQAPEPAPPGFLHGGFDHTKSWDKRPYICISHVMTYALARFGYLDDARLRRVYEYIADWQRLDGGWHPTEACLPGRDREKDESCPFGTVNVLRAVGANPELLESPVAKRGVEFVLNCWERRAEPYRPVGFGMGGTFNKLQVPFVQHQLLKTVDTLSVFPSAVRDSRYQDMLAAVTEKQSGEGLFTAEGINKPFAEFDFGQKKEPSPWITFIVARAHHRAHQQKGNGKRKATRKPRM